MLKDLLSPNISLTFTTVYPQMITPPSNDSYKLKMLFTFSVFFLFQKCDFFVYKELSPFFDLYAKNRFNTQHLIV